MEKRAKILALDLGYSALKYTDIDENGKMVSDKIISAAAKLPEPPTTADNDETFRLGADWFLLGPSALRTARSYLLPLETFEDMLAVYPAWVSYMLKKLEHIKFDKVAIGLSFAFVKKADLLLQTLYDALMISPDSQFFVCLPQAMSSRYTLQKFGANIRENAANATKVNDFDSYVIADIGYLTVDLCSVINRKSSVGATIGLPDTGIIVIARDMSDYIYKNFEYRISIKEAQTVVDTGILRRRGREVDLSEVVTQFTKRYFVNVLNLIEERYGEFLDAANNLVMLGGGASLFKKLLNDDAFCKEIEKHFPLSFIITPNDSSEYYNSISYLLITEDLIMKASGTTETN